MKYGVKHLTIEDKWKHVEFPEGVIILEVKSSTTLKRPGNNYKVWRIDYLEPLI